MDSGKCDNSARVEPTSCWKIWEYQSHPYYRPQRCMLGYTPPPVGRHPQAAPPRQTTPPGRHPSRQTQPLTATAADCTHPTGMHSCVKNNFAILFSHKFILYSRFQVFFSQTTIVKPLKSSETVANVQILWCSFRVY